jgi:hypothetical protein
MVILIMWNCQCIIEHPWLFAITNQIECFSYEAHHKVGY